MVPPQGPQVSLGEAAARTHLQKASGHDAVILGQHQVVHKHPEEGLGAAWPGPRILQDAVELVQVPRWGGGQSGGSGLCLEIGRAHV